MRKLFYTLLLALLFIVPFKVYAEEGVCSEEELATYKALASNIKEKYEHIGENKYKVSFLNIPEELFITDPFGFDYYVAKDYVDLYFGGKDYDFIIRTSDKTNCFLTRVDSKVLAFPNEKIEKTNTFFKDNFFLIISSFIIMILVIIFVVIKVKKNKKGAF